jgi:FtsH-binding integral membrane protein
MERKRDMTDIITIVLAIAAIYLIAKITFKVLKFFLMLAIIGLVIYILANYGFLSGIL